MENGVHGCAMTAGANSRRGATKKREISRNLFSINLDFSVRVKHVFFMNKSGPRDIVTQVM